MFHTEYIDPGLGSCLAGYYVYTLLQSSSSKKEPQREEAPGRDDYTF